MEFNFWSFILDNFEAAGAIGGYVSLSIIGFALISFVIRKNHGQIVDQIAPKWAHPIVGSFFGAIPGCGATIVVASLYKTKKISFGGLLASFISTLGEGSFVLLGASNEADVLGNLEAYAIITIFGIIAGSCVGYLSDFFGFRANLQINQNNYKEDKIIQTKQNVTKDMLVENLGFYVILTMSILLAPVSIMSLWGGEINAISDLTYWISILLTGSCITLYLVSKFIYKRNECYCDQDDVKETMMHAVSDVAMVVTYVFVGLFIANYIIDVLIGEEMFALWMTSSVYIVILLAALIGFTPGCGGMIAVAVAFMTIPNFPLAALIAAAIATSGDGIFPLLAENKKDGLIVSVLGLLVALVVGYIAILLGF